MVLPNLPMGILRSWHLQRTYDHIYIATFFFITGVLIRLCLSCLNSFPLVTCVEKPPPHCGPGADCTLKKNKVTQKPTKIVYKDNHQGGRGGRRRGNNKSSGRVRGSRNNNKNSNGRGQGGRGSGQGYGHRNNNGGRGDGNKLRDRKELKEILVNKEGKIVERKKVSINLLLPDVKDKVRLVLPTYQGNSTDEIFQWINALFVALSDYQMLPAIAIGRRTRATTTVMGDKKNYLRQASMKTCMRYILMLDNPLLSVRLDTLLPSWWWWCPQVITHPGGVIHFIYINKAVHHYHYVFRDTVGGGSLKGF